MSGRNGAPFEVAVVSVRRFQKAVTRGGRQYSGGGGRREVPAAGVGALGPDEDTGSASMRGLQRNAERRVS